MKIKIITISSFLLFLLFLYSLFVYAWQEPQVSPPQGNVFPPLNTAVIPQGKGGVDPNYLLTLVSKGLKITNTEDTPSLYIEDESGDPTPFVIDAKGNVGIGILDPIQKLEINGDVKIIGDIIDSEGNVIYDSNTKKIKPERLPFEKGDIVSDWETNTWAGGYYDVSNLTSNVVLAGVKFGRNQVGTLEVSTGAYILGKRFSTGEWEILAPLEKVVWEEYYYSLGKNIYRIYGKDGHEYGMCDLNLYNYGNSTREEFRRIVCHIDEGPTSLIEGFIRINPLLVDGKVISSGDYEKYCKLCQNGKTWVRFGYGSGRFCLLRNDCTCPEWHPYSGGYISWIECAYDWFTDLKVE